VQFPQDGGCPSLGSGSPKFGDVTCDGSLSGGDSIAILQHSAGLEIKPPQQTGCTPIGQTLPS
jgi:hypothetical protein